MVSIFKYFKPSFFLCATILFFVSSLAFANAERHFKSADQTKRPVKTKKRNKMNDTITGMWSGKHISFEIAENGAKIEFDCASGKIDGKIILNEKNRFDAPGTYAQEHGGPVRFGEQSNGYAVKYRGQVKGEKMTLTVKRDDDSEIVGTFTLLHNREPTLVKCR